ncbi:MAG: IS5/IS1182 family transposase, partial [Gammaproteobacteria bacterium]|nr:IS5/IS1182 family transposase [Gammaproteobacteria bacterium]
MELLWLLKRLCPDFKTIANFRKENPKAIVGVCRAFIRFCREQGLFGSELIAIDGSKFKAAASNKAVYTPKRIQRELARLDARIEAYLSALDTVDAAELTEAAGAGDTGAALEALQRRRTE